MPAVIGEKLELVTTKVAPTEPNPQLERLSPIGKIPVLVTDHGHHDSRVIIEYLCHISGNNTLIPDDGVKRFRVLTLQSIGQGVADIAGHVENGNGIEPSGIENDEFASADKVLTRGAHPQLNSLRGRVATDASDDLFDLHEVESGMGRRL